MNVQTLDEADFEATVFAFLDDLRESGVTNMFGAAPFIVREFDVSVIEARELLAKWMQQYGN